MFGDIEVLEDIPRETTCRCASKTAHVLVTSKTVRHKQDFQKRLQNMHTFAYLMEKGRRERLWMRDRIEGLMEIEKIKRGFTERLGKAYPVQPEPPSRSPSLGNYEAIRKNLERFSNITHRRMLSNPELPDFGKDSEFTQRLTNRPASVLFTKDKIAVALGTTRHPFLTRKRREFR